MAGPSVEQIIGHFEPAVAKDLLRRGFKVQAAARRYLSGASGHPKRVDTGALRSSVSVQLRSNKKVRVGTNKRYARWVHDGTGVYGPKKVSIKPKTAKALAFKSKSFNGKKGKGVIIVRSVKGMQRNQFLKDALPAFKP